MTTRAPATAGIGTGCGAGFFTSTHQEGGTQPPHPMQPNRLTLEPITSIGTFIQ